MRLEKRKRFLGVLGVLTVLWLSACAASPELQLARNAKMTGDLEAAYNLYMRVLHLEPGNAEALDAVNEISTVMTDRARREADGILQNAGGVTAPTLRLCLAKLDQYKAYDPQGAYLGNDRKAYLKKLEAIEKESRTLINQATLAILAGDYARALDLIDALKAGDPDHPDIETIEASYKKSYGVLLEEKIMTAYAAGRPDDANSIMKEWKALGLPKEEQKRLDLAVKSIEIKALQAKYRALMEKNQYYTAFLLLTENGHKDEFAFEFSELRQKGAPFYFDQALRRRDAGNVTRAYLEAVKGMAIDPQYPDMFDMHWDTRDQVLEKIRTTVAISTFGAPEDEPDAGERLTDALIGRLSRNLSFGISLVDRDKTDPVMTEQKQNFAEAARLLGADIIVSGSVLPMTIERRDTPSRKSVRVLMRETLEANPEYEAFIRRSDPKSEAEAPPKTIKVKEYGTFTVDRGKVEVEGVAGVAVTIFNAKKNEVTYAQAVNAHYRAEDAYQEGIEQAGVAADPLELPEDAEIKEKLSIQILQRLVDVIEGPFRNREKLFLENALNHIERQEMDLAVDELAKGYLFCTRSELDESNPDFKAIRNKIIELTEKEFI